MATTKFYGKVFLSAFNKEIDLDSDALKVVLLDNGYVPSQAHRYKSDLSNEISGPGYTEGGADLSSVVVGFDEASASFLFNGADVSWPNATLAARYAAIYDSAPDGDTAQPLIAYLDFGSDQSSTGGTLTLAWDDAGIATVSVS